jgi:hypothetical protein
VGVSEVRTEIKRESVCDRKRQRAEGSGKWKSDRLELMRENAGRVNVVFCTKGPMQSCIQCTLLQVVVWEYTFHVCTYLLIPTVILSNICAMCKGSRYLLLLTELRYTRYLFSLLISASWHFCPKLNSYSHLSSVLCLFLIWVSTYQACVDFWSIFLN